MKMIVSVALAAAMALASAPGQARGPAPSSFAPRGPEPHSTLADKHGTKGASHKTTRRNSGTHKRVPSHPPAH